jgi:hypothetical protein
MEGRMLMFVALACEGNGKDRATCTAPGPKEACGHVTCADVTLHFDDTTNKRGHVEINNVHCPEYGELANHTGGPSGDVDAALDFNHRKGTTQVGTLSSNTYTYHNDNENTTFKVTLHLKDNRVLTIWQDQPQGATTSAKNCN